MYNTVCCRWKLPEQKTLSKIKILQCMFRKHVQWNPSCEATPFVADMWPFKRYGLSSGVEINTFMFRFTGSSGLSRGVDLTSGWTHKRDSTVFNTQEYLFIKGR